jgi:uncharacterized protein (TIGR03000 family)
MALSMGTVGQVCADGHGGSHNGGHRYFYSGFYPGLYAGYGYFPNYGYFGYGYPSYYDSISDPGAELRFQMRWGPPYTDYYLEHPAPSRRSYGPVEPVVPVATTATLAIHVPAGAQVWFDDSLTSTTGEWRTFETPPLGPGISHYKIRARWTERDQVMDVSRQVDVKTGARSTVDFVETAASASK